MKEEDLETKYNKGVSSGNRIEDLLNTTEELLKEPYSTTIIHNSEIEDQNLNKKKTVILYQKEPLLLLQLMITQKLLIN